MLKSFLWLFLAAVIYFLLGRFGLMLAIPPGFASAVWPASGAALAMALRLPLLPVVLGVGLGSMILNLGVASDNYTQWQDLKYGIPLGICLGAMLQVLAGRCLYRLAVGTALPQTPRAVVWLLLVVGPLGCLVAATFGAGSLFFHGVIDLQSVSFTWLTWWIGDTIGVTLFAPLILVLFAAEKNLSRLRKLQITIPSLLVFAGILLVFFMSRNSSQLIIKKDVLQDADNWLEQIDKRLDISLSRVAALPALYLSSEFVSVREFESFAEELISDDPAIQAVGWTRIVPNRDRQLYELAMREWGFTDFEFTEFSGPGQVRTAGERALYYPVLYIYPFESNKLAHGVDLGANSERLAALNAAFENRTPVATAPIRLVQESGEQKAFIVYFPVFKSDLGADAEPRFLGYVSGVFRAADMLSGLLEQARDNGYGISVADVSDPDNAEDLLRSGLERNMQLPQAQSDIEVGGRQYRIQVFPQKGFQFSDRDWTSWLVITAGVLFAALLQSLILIITGTLSNIERQVRQKTMALRDALKDAEQASAAKSNFLSNISHELRTPLNAIIGLLRMSREEKPSPPISEYLEKAAYASETLLGLINQTLDFHKIESGKLEMEALPFDLARLLTKITAIFSIQSKSKGVQFDIKITSSLPDTLVGDALRIEQVLLNFCGNAFKFTSQGSVTLEVSAVDDGLQHTQLTLTISDTGMGIPEAQQQALFEPFRQADSSTTRKFGGTGLGLAISKRLVELMNGAIAFSSVEGKGSRFTIRLPLKIFETARWLDAASFSERILMAQPEQQETSRTDVNKSDSETEASLDRDGIHSDTSVQELSGVRILLVEDVPVNQLIAKHLLEVHGATVEVANHGREALEMLTADHGYDLVLMDIQMPEMDGYEATREIRKTWAIDELPVIAMTANAMEPEVQACLDCGMNSHIAKPIDERDVLVKLRPFTGR